jgi:cytochrome b
MNDTGANRKIATQQVRVWDLPVRLFHWVLVALLVALYVTGQTGRLDLHMQLGQAVLVLVVWRVLWGFVGSETALFSRFLKGPAAMLTYARSLFSPKPPPVVGHNPIGGLMVILLLAGVLVQAGSGLFATDDIVVEGPLYHLVSGSTAATLTTIHKIAINVLLALVAIHVAASLFYLVVKRDNLIGPMVTGVKPVPPTVAPPALASPVRALILLVVVAAAWLVFVNSV